NELRARIVGGDKPTITTWINGVKISEWTETEARHPARGHIALQVHGGGSAEDYNGKFVRYRGIRVKELDGARRD
ncbi:MAG: family 16 glycoside hydrolase, partial [Planctomycetota bacterium]